MMKKNIKISDDVMKKAGMCHKKYGCLDNTDGVCPITTALSDELIYVNKNPKEECRHYVSFGHNGFCTCPVRNELYKKYGL